MNTPLAIAARLARRAFHRLRRELRIRRAISDLSSMPDRALRDIGVTRSEIPSVVRYRPRDRSRRHRL